MQSVRRAAVSVAEQTLEFPCRRDGLRIRNLDDRIHHFKQEAGFYPGPADTFDQRGLVGDCRGVVTGPSSRKGAAAGFRHA